jgi:non-specific protein-tyrosine kinase
MSRIHEALKKAELERTHTPPAVVVGGTLLEQTTVLPTGPQNGGAVAAARPVAPAVAVEQGSQFQFSDLETRHQVHPVWHPDANSDVFASKQDSHGAEQFRILRSRLYQLRGARPFRTILITSSMAGEGKTFTAINLARALARQAERRVLIIGADLRCPRLYALFGAALSPGLSDYLKGSNDLLSIIQQGEAKNLCLIPSGTRVNDPSELLSNGRFKHLLERVAPAFDWIIIDSPPCLPVADAGTIASLCDGVLLVVRAGYTPAEVILRSKRELKDRNVVGVVLNAVSEDAEAYSSYYAYGYQAKNEAQASK